MADVKVADDKPEESRPVTEEEQKAIDELKARFTPEELAGVPEVRYLMFVRGYWQEQDRAETTYSYLKRTLEYRKDMDSDGLLNKTLEKEEKYLHLWPYDYHGTDKRGHVVYYERTAFANPSVLLSSLTERELQECHIQMQEVLMWLKNQTTEKIGALTYKSIVIMDMQDFGFQHLSTTFYNPIKSILTIDQYYYPETLYKLFVINAPFSFRTLWAVVKPWLHPLTQSRIQILGGSKEYLPKLKEIMDEDQIPRYIGGGCSCCEDSSIDKQIDRIYQRNCKWREERLAAKAAADEKKTTETATETTTEAPPS
eukprot:TRINITY_DN4574_c0_g2_i1.p1 TRINITY_DN4574_c0_g2~~TRINITY_DN4574_c0_g2_i1.p1  ORF type:complete len:312 (+),score=80.39 TRINITY_DN4574_c0_g2_i1:125-1060(+)